MTISPVPWLHRSLLVLIAGTVLAACGTLPAPPTSPLTLTIAHINDHHSQLEPATGELRLDGQPTQVELGGFPRLTTLFGQAARQQPNLLKLHAGDAVTGSLYYTLFKGEADARLMNTVCFDAFELGNHEFDDGDATLRRFLDHLHGGDCRTPVLAANVVPAAGTLLDGQLQPYAIKTVDGVPVGIIGIDIVGKTVNSSRPLATTRFLNEIETAQRTIDTLRGRGVRHIVLLTHQGYEADKAMAAALTDVDVIIGGDSHTLLGDFSAYGLTGSGAYPTVMKNRDDAPVCIGHAWEYGKVFGLMTVEFDRQGAVVHCGGQASLVIGDSFRRKGADGKPVPLEGDVRTALLARLAADPQVRVTPPDPGAAALLAGYSRQVAEQKARPIGRAAEALCLVRVPGESTNRSGSVPGCEQANTLARGSDVAQVVAEAFLHASRRADFALQNAGGARIGVPAGPLSMNTAFTLLPFTNVLVEMDLSGAEMVAALEDAVANHLDQRQSDGSHPYAAGLRWALDMSRPKGQRFSRVEVRDRATGAWAPIDPARRYVLVTNDFVADGKDGYAALGAVSRAGRAVNTYLLYTQTLADHLAARGTVGRPAAGEYSHQSVITPAGVRLP